MARVRITASVAGGTPLQRLRIHYRVWRLRFTLWSLTDYEAAVFLDRLTTEAETRGMDVQFWGRTR